MINFDEIIKPFDIEEAVIEAKRCLNCKKPLCVEGCPIKNDIPTFIQEVACENILGAKKILDRTTNLSRICSRVCNHEIQCVGNCILNKKGRAIDVGKLERFVSDYYYKNTLEVKKSKSIERKVALIGSGPSSIACSKVLSEKGIDVTIFEKEAYFGGQLYSGIPEYRLKNEVVKDEEDILKKLGIKIIYNCEVGKDILLDDLVKSFDYIYIGVGASEPKTLKISGLDLSGVYQASEILKEASIYQDNGIDNKDFLIKEGNRVLVIGGGNVAMDASRVAKRFTDDVKIVYRRWREVMPASDFEYNESIKDNIEYNWKRTPIEFVGENGKFIGLKVLNTNDDENNFEEIIDGDIVIIAIGSNLDKGLFRGFNEPKLNDKWFLESNDCKLSGYEKIFLGGDATLSPATVVEAVKTGIEAGNKIIEDINNS